MEIFSTEGWYFLLRYMHFLAGITWIGVLYYFNFIQTPFFGSELGGPPADGRPLPRGVPSPEEEARGPCARPAR